MSTSAHLIVDLELDPQSIRGSARHEDGLVAAFEGWLGLIALVEAAQAALRSAVITGPRDAIGNAGERNQCDE